jgi:hypothetical protein
MVVVGQRHTPAALPSGKRPGIHCMGGCVGPRAGLDGCGKSCLDRDSIPEPSSPWQVAIRTELPGPRVAINKVKVKVNSVTGDEGPEGE